MHDASRRRLASTVIFLSMLAAAAAVAGAQGAVRPSPYYRGPADTLAARRLSGCYTVRVGAWSDARANGGRIVTPAEIRLDTARVAHPYPGSPFAVETPGFVNPSHFAMPTAWGPVHRDSLQANLVADGTSSVTVFARRHTDGTFTAIARYFTDAIAVDPVTKRWLWEMSPTAPVQLTPHACARGR